MASEDKKYPNVPDRYEERTGTMYYKSGWMVKKGHGLIGSFRSKQRWVQLIHSYCYYYEEWQPWYNWGGTTPPSEDDVKGLSLPKIPGLPDLPGMPKVDMPKLDMPDMPKVDMPDAPKVDMPDMPKISAPKRKERIPGGPLGSFPVRGTKIKKSGKTLTISGCQQTVYWKGETEHNDNITFEFTAPSDEQAESWYESFAYGGAEKDE